MARNKYPKGPRWSDIEKDEGEMTYVGYRRSKGKKVPQKKTDGHREIVHNAVVSAVKKARDLSEGVRGCAVFADAKLAIRMLLRPGFDVYRHC
ncbi:hypothetical protein VTO73DRAFT_12966 [Trametes versicolor]